MNTKSFKSTKHMKSVTHKYAILRLRQLNGCSPGPSVHSFYPPKPYSVFPCRFRARTTSIPVVLGRGASRVKIVDVSVEVGRLVGKGLSIEESFVHQNQGGTCDSFSAPMLRVRHRIADDILQEDLG